MTSILLNVKKFLYLTLIDLTDVGVARVGFFYLQARPILNDARNIFAIGERKHCFMDNAAGCAAHTLVAIACAAYIVAGTAVAPIP